MKKNNPTEQEILEAISEPKYKMGATMLHRDGWQVNPEKLARFLFDHLNNQTE